MSLTIHSTVFRMLEMSSLSQHGRDFLLNHLLNDFPPPRSVGRCRGTWPLPLDGAVSRLHAERAKFHSLCTAAA